MHDYIRCQVKVVDVTSSQSFELKKAPSLCRTSKNNFSEVELEQNYRFVCVKKTNAPDFFCWWFEKIEFGTERPNSRLVSWIIGETFFAKSLRFFE